MNNLRDISSNPGSPFRVVGTVTLTSSKQVTDRGFQNASWWRRLNLAPQTVALETNGYYVQWRFEGTVVEDNFCSQYGGVNIGTYDRKQNKGSIEAFWHRPYAYQDLEATYPDMIFEISEEQ